MIRVDANIEAAFTRLRAAMRDLEFTLDRAKAGEPAEHWSPWLEWRGGPCPLPGNTIVELELRDGREEGCTTASAWNWNRHGLPRDIVRFRYRPAGWLPRGKFIPPAELWDEGCPVRCEWINAPADSSAIQREQMTPSTWSLATHIRLVARQPQAGLPEGWWITHIGHLVQPNGYVALTHDVVSRYGPDAVLGAVQAWLRETGDE